MPESCARDIAVDDIFPQTDTFVTANKQYIKELVFEAEEYVVNLVKSSRHRQPYSICRPYLFLEVKILLL